jgi:hypothetical protein
MRRICIACALAAVAADITVAAQQPANTRDLQGMWTNGTATPLQRPQQFAEKPTLTEEEAAAWEKGGLSRLISLIPHDDLVTAGDLTDTYLDTSSLKLVEGRRTSLIVDPPSGLLPARVPAARKRDLARPARSLDNFETMNLDERCLSVTVLGTSAITPPMVPNTFGGNYYQIVQSPTHVLILNEMMHIARVIRIGGTHVPAHVQFWLGDSIGRWEGNTLVVDTTNFYEKTRFRGASERLHVVERFTRSRQDSLSYRVTVEDPETWETPWTADIPFTAMTERMFEDACHEGNYSLGNSLRGARFTDAIK